MAESEPIKLTDEVLERARRLAARQLVRSIDDAERAPAERRTALTRYIVCASTGHTGGFVDQFRVDLEAVPADPKVVNSLAHDFEGPHGERRRTLFLRYAYDAGEGSAEATVQDIVAEVLDDPEEVAQILA